jgi:MarR family transcriptional regulator for hemolysin
MEDKAAPPSARRRFGKSLALLGRHWRRCLDSRLANGAVFAGVTLTAASWSPLIHLQDAGDGISQKDLAARVGIDGSSLVRLIDSLVAQQLVERRPDAQDRRIKKIYLTAQGHQVVEAVRVHLADLEDGLLADLSDDEIEMMLRAFAAIERRLGEPHAPFSDLQSMGNTP